MMKIVTLLCLCVFLVDANATDYKYHQMWSYKTRGGEENSKVLINQVDSTEEYGDVYHITIFYVKIKNSKLNGGVIKTIPYLAVSKEALDKSLLKLTATRYPYKKFLNGYIKWKRELKIGKATVHNDSIANIIDKLENDYNGN